MRSRQRSKVRVPSNDSFRFLTPNKQCPVIRILKLCKGSSERTEIGPDSLVLQFIGSSAFIKTVGLAPKECTGQSFQTGRKGEEKLIYRN